MCRNVRTLTNFEPPATRDEIRASSLQFVRKISGSTHPSRANEDVFNRAVDEVAATVTRLVKAYKTSAPPRTRESDREKAQARNLKRFGRATTIFDHAP